MLRRRSVVAGLDPRVANDDVVSDQRVTNPSGDVDAVGITGDRILLDDVAAASADQANAEVVGWIGVSIPMCCV